MARYAVLLSKKAHKFLFKIDKELSIRVLKESSDLQNFPFLTLPHDLAKLKGGETIIGLESEILGLYSKLPSLQKGCILRKSAIENPSTTDILQPEVQLEGISRGKQ